MAINDNALVKSICVTFYKSDLKTKKIEISQNPDVIEKKEEF